LCMFALLVISTDWNLVLAWVVAWTPASFLLYGYDKMQAKRGGLRVPEISLLTIAGAGGFAGALAAMVLFRHKTTRLKFWIVAVGSGIIFCVLLIATAF